MTERPKFLHVLGDNPGGMNTTRYKAVLMAYGEGGENSFGFAGPPDLMEQPADDVVETFITAMNARGMTTVPFRYELNGAVKHDTVLTAMGSLLLKGKSFPFILMIAPAE